MLVTSFCWLADNFKYLLSLLTLMLPSQLAVVGWFPAANVLADRHTAAGVTWLKEKKNIHVFIQPGGSHLARISTLPEKEKEEVMKLLNEWLR